MKPKKTWKDLQHGDVIELGHLKGTVIEVFKYMLVFEIDSLTSCLSFESLEKRGWQIVQPEEEYRKELEKAQFCDPRI